MPELQNGQGAPAWGQLLAGLLKCLELRGDEANAAGLHCTCPSSCPMLLQLELGGLLHRSIRAISP